MAHCIECKRKEGDTMQYGDNDRYVTVKLVNGRYGKLCQRHATNAYARAGTARKRKSKRDEQVRRAREEFGQISMFAEEEGNE